MRVSVRLLPINSKMKSSRLEKMTTRISTLLSAAKGSGLITEFRPNTQNMLKMLEPTTLPMAMSVFLF